MSKVMKINVQLVALFSGGLITLYGCSSQAKENTKVSNEDASAKHEQTAEKKPDSYWKEKLSPEVYQVTRCSATEPAFTGKYWNNHDIGLYKCSNCGELLFDSKTKFDSGTGWPSFSDAEKNSVGTVTDNSFGMTRTEAVCKHCGAHLGHLFDDGTSPLREAILHQLRVTEFRQNEIVQTQFSNRVRADFAKPVALKSNHS